MTASHSRSIVGCCMRRLNLCLEATLSLVLQKGKNPPLTLKYHQSDEIGYFMGLILLQMFQHF